jgi:hypothetical protein
MHRAKPPHATKAILQLSRGGEERGPPVYNEPSSRFELPRLDDRDINETAA